MTNDLNLPDVKITPQELLPVVPTLMEKIHGKLKNNLPSELQGNNKIQRDDDKLLSKLMSHHHEGSKIIDKIPFNPAPVVIAGVDSSCICLAETEDGLVFASRVATVFSCTGRIYNYGRIGPILTFLNESNVKDLAKNNKNLAYLMLSEPSVAERVIRDKLESLMHMELVSNLNGFILAIDGCPTQSKMLKSDSSVELLRKAQRKDSDVIFMSKTSRDRSILYLSEYIASIPKAQICLDLVELNSEDITEELSRQLTSLNSGESLLTGRFVKIPTLAKIDDVSELKGFGSDISATEGWAKAKKMKKTKSSQELIDKDDI